MCAEGQACPGGRVPPRRFAAFTLKPAQPANRDALNIQLLRWKLARGQQDQADDPDRLWILEYRRDDRPDNAVLFVNRNSVARTNGSEARKIRAKRTYAAEIHPQSCTKSQK